MGHTSEQGHWSIIRKKLAEENKPINDTNRRPPVVTDSYPENDKLHNDIKETVLGNTT